MDATLVALLTALGIAILIRIAISRHKRKSDTDKDYQVSTHNLEYDTIVPPAILPTKPHTGQKTAMISNVCKSYNGKAVVNNVSFDIYEGESFGMVGPNGAGKTTTIRMMMDIVKPDSGEIYLLGEPLNEETKNLIGYLPEERGLYRKSTVTNTLTYLATLKNMETRLAKDRAQEFLSHSDMLAHKDKNIEELSKGMGQIIQFIGTILHDPQVIVLDEPFSGLDPVNSKLLKQMILDLKSQGKSVILSSHMMNEVETMCDRVLMINKGVVALYGNLAEIKSRYRNNSVLVDCDHLPKNLPGISRYTRIKDLFEITLDGTSSPQDVLSTLVTNGITVNRFEISTPSLEDIFIQVAKEGR
ncbi:MAG: ATP-binding cassette domain-containing protein [Chloroflexota bacterium]|nr:ATP-binding cassette domain-containing protein [Chloroflexota bacterium]